MRADNRNRLNFFKTGFISNFLKMSAKYSLFLKLRLLNKPHGYDFLPIANIANYQPGLCVISIGIFGARHREVIQVSVQFQFQQTSPCGGLCKRDKRIE